MNFLHKIENAWENKDWAGVEDSALQLAQAARICCRLAEGPATESFDLASVELFNILQNISEQLLFHRPQNINWRSILSSSEALKKLAERELAQ